MGSPDVTRSVIVLWRRVYAVVFGFSLALRTASLIGFFQVSHLNHGPHCTIQHQDAWLQVIAQLTSQPYQILMKRMKFKEHRNKQTILREVWIFFGSVITILMLNSNWKEMEKSSFYFLILVLNARLLVHYTHLYWINRISEGQHELARWSTLWKRKNFSTHEISATWHFPLKSIATLNSFFRRKGGRIFSQKFLSNSINL